MILKHKWAKEAIKNTAFFENINFYFFYLTVKLYAFDSNTYDGSTDGEKGGCRVVPKVKTIPFMYETLWLVFTNVEKKWVEVNKAIVFYCFSRKIREGCNKKKALFHSLLL